ncbi:hypothetical protein AAMO2058_000245900 [Amorphochlora amoebiformis]
MGKQQRSRRRRGRKARVDPIGKKVESVTVLEDLAPIEKSLTSTDPAARASACTAVVGMVVNSGERAAPFCLHLARRGIVKRLIPLMTDRIGHVSVAATRAISKMAMCGGQGICHGLVKSDILTPIISMLTGSWIQDLKPQVRDPLVLHSLELLCCVTEQCDIVGELTKKGTVGKVIEIFLDDQAPWAVRVAAGSVVSVCSDDNEQFGALMLTKEGKVSMEALLKACAREFKEDGRRPVALCCSVVANIASTDSFKNLRPKILPNVLKGLQSVVSGRPVELMPVLAEKIHVRNRKDEQDLLKAQQEAKVDEKRAHDLISWNGHRKVEAWENLVDQWCSEASGVKVGLETLANLLTDSKETNESFSEVLKAVVSGDIPKCLGVLFQDTMSASYALSGLRPTTGVSLGNKVNLLSKAWAVLKQEIPMNQAIRIGRLIRSLSVRVLQCFFNLTLHLDKKDLGDMSGIFSSLGSWMQSMCSTDGEYSKTSSKSLLARQMESSCAVIWQLVKKRCVALPDHALLSQLSRGGKTSETRAYCLMALSSAGLTPSMKNSNIKIGETLLAALDGKGDPSLEVIGAAIEGLIDLYSEDHVFLDEQKVRMELLTPSLCQSLSLLSLSLLSISAS